MKKEDLRVVPFKNYIILLGVLAGSFLLLYYFYIWFDAYEENKLNRRILDNYMQIINYNELDNYLVENPDTILYVSVLQDEKIREFEKLVKKKYREKLIDRDILYLDITTLSDVERNNLRSRYYYNNLDILSVPCVVVFNNGIIDAIYSVGGNGYDIDKFVMYINQINYEMGDLND